MAMDGPNGMGVFRPCPRSLNTTIPITRPIIEARNSVNNVLAVPSTSPINKNSLISPPPMPPFDTTAMTSNSPNPTTAPTMLSHHGSSGEKIRAMTSSGKKNSKILFGMSIYEISEILMITSSEINSKATTNSAVKPSCT